MAFSVRFQLISNMLMITVTFLAPEVSRSMEKLRGDYIYDMITGNGVSDEEFEGEGRGFIGKLSKL